MADSENQQPVDTTQQVTSLNPTTRTKNPKRVAAGKATAEKTRQAREQQKKALAEAQLILANQKNQEKEQPDAAPVAAPVVAPVTSESARDVLTTTQWLTVVSIIVTLLGVYYKREEIKARFTQKPPPSPVDVAPQRVAPQSVAPKKGGICPMD